MTNLDINNQLLIIHRASYSPPAYVHVYLGWQTGVHGACDLGSLRGMEENGRVFS